MVLLVWAGAAVAQNGDVAVVVNSGNPATTLSLSDLKKILAGEKRAWTGNIPVKLIIRGPGAHERQVLLHLLSMSEGDYKQYWTAQIYRGEAQAEPTAVPSNGIQKEALSVFPGAIALVDVSDLKPGMKVIKIDGHLPGETDYPSELSDYRLKADLLYHFIQFIEWPAGVFKSADSPLTLCAFGTDAFRRALDDRVSGKVIGGRLLLVERYRDSDAKMCQILFISATDERGNPLLLASMKSLSVVTVGDTSQFLAQGGMIGFHWKGSEIRFDVNLEAVTLARVKLSSRLLSSAASVVGGPKGN